MKVACGMTVTVFRPSSPATTPNPESIIKGLMDSKSDIIICAPSLVEVFRTNRRRCDILNLSSSGMVIEPKSRG
jgi:hypothetical protein